MKLLVKTCELVDGANYVSYWRKPLVLVNGEYLASTDPNDNINGKPFDLVVGETAFVILQDGKQTWNRWIIRG